MKTVKEIYDYSLNSQKISTGEVPLLSFLNMIPEFYSKDEKGLCVMKMSLGQEYLRIVEKMCKNMLLFQVKQVNIIQLDGEYIAVPVVNSTNPDEFIHELDGVWDV